MKNFYLSLFVSAFLLVGCAPKPIVRVNPSTTQGVWLWGQHFVFDTTSNIHVYIAFDREFSDNELAFSVEYVNESNEPFLVDPAQIEVVAYPFNSAKYETKTYYAVDPEQQLLETDMAISRSQAQSKNSAIIAALVLGAGVAQTVSDVNRNASYEQQVVHQNMAVAGADLAQAAGIAADFNVMKLANNRQVWETQTLRKTTLPPNMSIQGRILIPKDLKILNYQIIIPLLEKKATFMFEQKIYKPNVDSATSRQTE